MQPKLSFRASSGTQSPVLGRFELKTSLKTDNKRNTCAQNHINQEQCRTVEQKTPQKMFLFHIGFYIVPLWEDLNENLQLNQWFCNRQVIDYVLKFDCYRRGSCDIHIYLATLDNSFPQKKSIEIKKLKINPEFFYICKIFFKHRLNFETSFTPAKIKLSFHGQK